MIELDSHRAWGGKLKNHQTDRTGDRLHCIPGVFLIFWLVQQHQNLEFFLGWFSDFPVRGLGIESSASRVQMFNTCFLMVR